MEEEKAAVANRPGVEVHLYLKQDLAGCLLGSMPLVLIVGIKW